MYKNSLYYFCNFPIHLKSFQNTTKKLKKKDFRFWPSTDGKHDPADKRSYLQLSNRHCWEKSLFCGPQQWPQQHTSSWLFPLLGCILPALSFLIPGVTSDKDPSLWPNFTQAPLNSLSGQPLSLSYWVQLNKNLPTSNWFPHHTHWL